MFDLLTWPYRKWKGERAWKRSEKLIADMERLGIRKIVIEREPGQDRAWADMTFYWDNGNTQEPWCTNELVDAPAKRWLIRKFGQF